MVLTKMAKRTFETLIITLFVVLLMVLKIKAMNAPHVDSSNFSVVVKSDYYVDKSSFIADFFKHNQSVQIITVPPKFGKSTIIDMVNRFAEIVSDGRRRPINQTDNYKLFFDYRFLKISAVKELIAEHFGRHPVIRIDCRPLRTVRDYRSTVDAFRSIIRRTFGEHRYLAANDSLFTAATAVRSSLSLSLSNDTSANDKSTNDTSANDTTVLSRRDLFKAHLNDNTALTDEGDMFRSFDWLAELLHKHFGQPVLVLVDDYDAHYQAVWSSDNVTDADKIVEFVQLTRGFLNSRNDQLYRCLLIGTLRRVDDWQKWYNDDADFGDYRFLDNHTYSRHFGFVETEVDQLLLRTVDSERLNEIRRIVTDHYGGYSVPEQNIRLWNTWSLIQFLQSGKKSNNNRYYPINRYNETIAQLLSIDDVHKLLITQAAFTLKPIKSFSKAHLRALNGGQTKTDDDKAILVDVAKRFLSDLGFFTRRSENNYEISNSEMKTTLSEMLSSGSSGR